MPPKISIVTPSRNAKSFLKDSLKSVQDQGYAETEHIVIDADSSDGTKELLEEQPNVRWISEPDQGQSDALNKGFRLASGEILGWLNADDRYLPGTFAKVAALFENDPSLDAVYSNFYFTDLNFHRIRPIYSNRPISWLSLFYCYIPSTTFFVRRRVIEEGNFLDTSYSIVMDKEFFSRLLKKGYRFRYVNDFFAEFRIHGQNVSLPGGRRNPRMTEESLRMLHERLGGKLPWTSVEIVLYAFIHLLIKPIRLCIRGRGGHL